MSLLKRIEDDFVQAYKAKDQLTVAVLRLLKTALKNKQVELIRPLTDDDALDVVLKQVKQRQESIEQFSSAGRLDLRDKEAAELSILQTYLPSLLTPEETNALVDETIASLGAKEVKDMGRVMQAITSKYKGRVDAKTVSELVRTKLGAR